MRSFIHETDHQTWLLCNTETGLIAEWDPQFFEEALSYHSASPRIGNLHLRRGEVVKLRQRLVDLGAQFGFWSARLVNRIESKMRVIKLLFALFARPWLWWTAIKLAVRMKPDHGWLPPKEYLQFRSSVYGAPIQEIPVKDFVNYLWWCKRFPGPVK